MLIAAAPAPAEAPVAIGTAGREPEGPVRPVTTVLPPTGLNGIWIEFDGRRWYAEGRSIAYDAARLNEVGRYHGFTVYAPREGAADTIYVPVVPGRLARYVLKK